MIWTKVDSALFTELQFLPLVRWQVYVRTECAAWGQRQGSSWKIFLQMGSRYNMRLAYQPASRPLLSSGEWWFIDLFSRLHCFCSLEGTLQSQAFHGWPPQPYARCQAPDVLHALASGSSSRVAFWLSVSSAKALWGTEDRATFGSETNCTCTLKCVLSSASMCSPATGANNGAKVLATNPLW